jgi:hypothetical protein
MASIEGWQLGFGSRIDRCERYADVGLDLLITRV